MRLTTVHSTVAHDDNVWSTCWAGDASTGRLLTGSVDETVKCWEDGADQLKSVHTYRGHTLGVVSVAVSSSGEVAAASALDSIIRVWNLASHETVSIIETASTETWSIAFNPLPDLLQLATAAGTRRGLVLWNVGAETAIQAELHLPQADDERSKGKEQFVLSVAYSPDGRRLACGAMDGTVVVFDVASGKALHALEGHYKPVRSLTFLPDSKTLLTACDDMHVLLHDVENASLVESFSGHESWVLSVSAHPSAAAFVTGGSDAKVKLWDLAARACTQTLTDHTDSVWSVAFNAEGNRVASVGDDRKLVTYSCA